MVKVTLDGTTLAESDKTIIIEGNHYFPPDSVLKSAFKDSTTTSVCPWKGNAKYYHLELPSGTKVTDVAWYYPEPKEKAKQIAGYLAFYKNKVEITE